MYIAICDALKNYEPQWYGYQWLFVDLMKLIRRHRKSRISRVKIISLNMCNNYSYHTIKKILYHTVKKILYHTVKKILYIYIYIYIQNNSIIYTKNNIIFCIISKTYFLQ